MKTGMMATSRRLAVAAVCMLSFSFAGCTESTNITLHEPGVYKGSVDPLLATQSDPAQIETLQKRFMRGQSDR